VTGPGRKVAIKVLHPTKLLMLRSVGEERLIVAHNWDEELRARLRSRNSQ
jgi:hypothetical protein